MKYITRIEEGEILRPGLNLYDNGWCLYVPLWTKWCTQYNAWWMEDQTGYWRYNWFLRYGRGKFRAEFYWRAPE